MRVILTEKVKSLGNVGEMVNVSPGYARNYLIPLNFAILATEGNKKYIEDQQKRLQKKMDEHKNEALGLKKKLDGVVLEMFRKVGGNGKLFGTVTSSELVKELQVKDIEVERKTIHIDNPIKQLGEFNIKVKIFADVEAQFKVKVLMDPHQAEEMKKKQALGEKRKKEKQAQEMIEGEAEKSSEESEAEA